MPLRLKDEAPQAQVSDRARASQKVAPALASLVAVPHGRVVRSFKDQKDVS